jgi:hypothetical protein
MAEPTGNLPSLDCDQGACARREIAAAYLAMRAGRAPPPSSLPGPLPDSCCRRPAARGRCDGGLTSVAPSPRRPPKSSILAGAASFGHGTGMRLGSEASRCRLRSTGAIMGNVVYDFLLFSCMALFVTGIVLAAASLLI